MALMTEDCVFENTYPPPDGARLEGAAAVRAYWHDLFQQSPHAHFAVEDVFACAERAVLRWRYSWLAADGSAGHVRGVDIFRVRDGKWPRSCHTSRANAQRCQLPNAALQSDRLGNQSTN